MMTPNTSAQKLYSGLAKNNQNSLFDCCDKVPLSNPALLRREWDWVARLIIQTIIKIVFEQSYFQCGDLAIQI